MESFKKLGISQRLIQAIEESKFIEPTEIQEKTIPLVIEGKDVIAQSATGSGKTLAFGSGIIEKAQRGKGVQGLVLTPTRELAEQVGQALRRFSKHFGINVTEVYGGVSINPQKHNIAKAEIVVGTPGRILDHLRQGTLNLRNVKTLVLDEADRMLDMGFIEDITTIISQCPKERQTLLFSATIGQDIEHIGRRYMKHPQTISAESYVDATKLTQIYYDVPSNLKFSLLVHLLKHEHVGLVMIFCNTRTNADFVAKNLKRYGLDAIAIHGGLSQNVRNRVMEIFHSNKVSILVCTDVAARGLDIKNVSHIYNYEIPGNSTEYIHRIGRTARAGKEGMAINIVAQRDYENFRKVLQNDELKIEKMELPRFEEIKIKFGDREYGGRGRFNRSRQGYPQRSSRRGNFHRGGSNRDGYKRRRY